MTTAYKNIIGSVLFIFLLMNVLSVRSQVPKWIWFRRYTNAIGNDIEIDDSGNLYVTGKYFNKLTINGKDYSDWAGSYDLFLIKFNNHGQFEWISTAGGIYDDHGNDLLVLGDNIYVSGYVSESPVFDSIVYPVDVLYQYFLAQYSIDNNFQWVIFSDPPTQVQLFSMTIDKENYIYLAGLYYYGPFYFNEDSLRYVDYYEALLVKMNLDGNIIWAVSGTGQSFDQIYSVTADNQSNIIIAGTFKDSVCFNSANGDTSIYLVNRYQYNTFPGTEPDSSDEQLMLLKYSSEGKLLWAKHFSSQYSYTIRGLDTDSDDNIYLMGNFGYELNFHDTIGGKDPTKLTTKGMADVFVAKLSPAGDLIWNRQFGGAYADDLGRLTVKNDALYIAAGFNATISVGDSAFHSCAPLDAHYLNSFIAKYDLDGNFLWARNMQSSSNRIYGIDVDSNGNVYLTGYIHGDIILDGVTYSRQGSRDFFIAKLSEKDASIEVIDEKNSIELYPNPASEYLNIKMPGKELLNEIKIYCLTGELLKTIKCKNHEITLNLQSLVPGQYILTLTTDRKTINKKIVINH
jgi:hypothetical protein